MRTLRVAPEWLAVRDPGLVTWCPVSQGRPELTVYTFCATLVLSVETETKLCMKQSVVHFVAL
jgi:hypothetical protein